MALEVLHVCVPPFGPSLSTSLASSFFVSPFFWRRAVFDVSFGTGCARTAMPDSRSDNLRVLFQAKPARRNDKQRKALAACELALAWKIRPRGSSSSSTNARYWKHSPLRGHGENLGLPCAVPFAGAAPISLRALLGVNTFGKGEAVSAVLRSIASLEICSRAAAARDDSVWRRCNPSARGEKNAYSLFGRCAALDGVVLSDFANDDVCEGETRSAHWHRPLPSIWGKLRA